MTDSSFSDLKLSERIEKLGFEVSATEEAMQSSVKVYVTHHRGRSTVGPVLLALEPDDAVDGESAPFQFNDEHDQLFEDARSKPSEEVTIFNSLQRSIMSTIVESAVLSVQPIGGHIDRATQCLRVDVYVAAERKFRSHRVFERLFRHCFGLMFSADLLPVINVVFVDFLPGDAALSAVFDYAVDDTSSG